MALPVAAAAAAGVAATGVRIVAGSAKATTRQTVKSSSSTTSQAAKQRGATTLASNQAIRQAGKYDFEDGQNDATVDSQKQVTYRNQLAAKNANSIVHNRAARLVKQQFVENYQEDTSKVAYILNRISKKTKALSNAFKTASGLVRSAEISPFVGLLYIPQFLFALLFISTVYVEQEWWFVSWVIPGEALVGVAWVAIIFFGVISMFIAAFAYGRLLLSSVILVSGFICFVGYWTPYVFIIPWVFVWMIVINMTNIMNTAEAIRE